MRKLVSDLVAVPPRRSAGDAVVMMCLTSLPPERQLEEIRGSVPARGKRG